MTTNDITRMPRLRLSLLLWLAGMLGVVVITVTFLPQLLGEVTLPAPLWVISLASFAQSALLVALVVFTGVALAPKVGTQPMAQASSGSTVQKMASEVQKESGAMPVLYLREGNRREGECSHDSRDW
jgi:hypothetical protein